MREGQNWGSTIHIDPFRGIALTSAGCHPLFLPRGLLSETLSPCIPLSFSPMLNPSSSTRLLIQRAVFAAVLSMLLVCQGCASNAMLARDLPREWHATSASNAQTVDLTKLASATIPNDLIARGDVIAINIGVGRKKEDDVSVKQRVNQSGQIVLTHIGDVSVEGLNLIEAEDAIRTAATIRGIYRDPQITVEMSRPKVNNITVIGAVNKQGILELRPGNSDLLQAITAAGGLTKEAGTIVEVTHPGFKPGTVPPERSPAIANGTGDGVISAGGESIQATPVSTKTLKVDLASIGRDGVGIPTLSDGMVIWVGKLDPLPLTVDGLVRAPGQFEFPVGKNLSVVEAISLAKGINSSVADKIYVIRKRPGVAEPVLIQVSYSKAKRDGRENILLQPGDVVSVEQTPTTVFIEVLKTATFGVTGRVF